ncbi:MAG TPA: abortive infection family protein [Aldersonia sp.]
MPDLVSTRTRGYFRDAATDSTVGAIEAAFQDEGIAPNPDCAYEDSSVRRRTAQSYLESVNWSDPDHVARALRAMERIIEDFPEEYSVAKFWKSLERDGYRRDPESGVLDIPVRTLAAEALANLKDAAAIRGHLTRIQRALNDDPELAIGSAKELIESTAKLVLDERGVAYDQGTKITALIPRAQDSLGLSPGAASGGPDGGSSIKRILGGASSVALGVAELRNQYGTGHGSTRARSGLGPRHAHLAVNAAIMWCQLMFDTLADPAAPWRKQQP